jgi:hypothetical protein
MTRGASLADAIPADEAVLTESGAEGDDNWRVRGCRFRLVRRQVAVIIAIGGGGGSKCLSF